MWPSNGEEVAQQRGRANGASSRAPVTGVAAPGGVPASMNATMSPSNPASRTSSPSSTPTRGPAPAS